jgi:tetratricopeptide (TPR) repeat protein
MLPVLLNRYSDAPLLEKVRNEVARVHPRRQFRELELRLAVLHDDLGEAVRQALKWTDEALFEPEASTWAVFLLTQVEDRYDEAIRLGKKALQRMPAAFVVANNTAYSMALAGQVDHARRLLRPEEDGVMFDLATQGLISAAKGDISEANRLYDRAEEVAKRKDQTSSPLLVNLHRRLIAVAAPETTDRALVSKPVILPQDWDDEPALVLCLRMLQRRGAPLDEITVEGLGPIPDSIEPPIANRSQG